MDDVVSMIKVVLPTVGTETTYSALYDDVVNNRGNVMLLPAAIRELKRQGVIRQEVGKRQGDTVTQHRIIRIG